MIQSQRDHYNLDKGFLVCNTKSAIIGLVITFATIEAAFGLIDGVHVVTEQALLGEEHICDLYRRRANFCQARTTLAWLQWTSLATWYLHLWRRTKDGAGDKISLGHANKENMSFTQRLDLKVSPTCTSVDVTDGHVALVSLRFAKRPSPNAEQVKKDMRGTCLGCSKAGLPISPRSNYNSLGAGRSTAATTRLSYRSALLC